MIENAERAVTFATAEKLGTAMLFVVEPARALTDLVTELDVPRNLLEPYELLGIRLVAKAS